MPLMTVAHIDMYDDDPVLSPAAKTLDADVFGEQTQPLGFSLGLVLEGLPWHMMDVCEIVGRRRAARSCVQLAIGAIFGLVRPIVRCEVCTPRPGQVQVLRVRKYTCRACARGVTELRVVTGVFARLCAGEGAVEVRAVLHCE